MRGTEPESSASAIAWRLASKRLRAVNRCAPAHRHMREMACPADAVVSFARSRPQRRGRQGRGNAVAENGQANAVARVVAVEEDGKVHLTALPRLRIKLVTVCYIKRLGQPLA